MLQKTWVEIFVAFRSEVSPPVWLSSCPRFVYIDKFIFKSIDILDLNFIDIFIDIIYNIYHQKSWKEVIVMDQISTVGMMKRIVPITRFNKGEANKIFDEVQSSGTKIVMKNNRPACVLVSPEQYEALVEMLSDYSLFMEAEQRMAANHDEENIGQEEMMRSLGITQDELDSIDVEIEE